MRLPTKDPSFPYNDLSHRTQSQFKPYISLSQSIVRQLLRIFPSAFKPLLYTVLARASSSFGKSPYRHIFRLPFNLVLKTSVRSRLVEADALRFVGSLNSINAPMLIDSTSTPQITYILSTWVDGDCCSEVWEQLTSLDKDKVVEDLRSQFDALRLQTASHDHVICNASGDAIEDPRIPWLDDDPRVFTSYSKFMEQVWLGLNFPRNRDTLYPLLKPFVERDDVPVVFSHGDLLPKNLILPGGLEQWRRDHRPLCIVDWEHAGWMPLSWEALKATWLLCDPEEDWYKMVAEVFPESRTELEMDWQWRARSGIPIV
ncbi:hypothetical protein ACEPAG_403 [Sanghuangporus baumii]